ncbi:uncharacterized protein DUF1656 [Paucimonas lemoignei]|uniref:Uncharacterized protein DUF1656 n=1 Tax=Paucimonas lemoignei TaxID=29443 RepID=A0A4R3I2U3_PAULE|nr:DUF1656 domain-containing protein [Paucimonas lemoignei]TCS39353.1 uncharacterized protein DUF1656 [Paucimonas lemoignei]
MSGEFNLYGLYVPWLLVQSLLALALSRGMSWVLARLGFYRLVWHPALFDAALFVLILGALVFLSSTGFY